LVLLYIEKRNLSVSVDRDYVIKSLSSEGRKKLFLELIGKLEKKTTMKLVMESS